MMNKKRLMICTATAMMATLAMGTSAMAASYEKAFGIDMENGTDEMWSKLAMVNDDKVTTGVNIREAADGEIIGCLYNGGLVEILYKDEVWSEVQSGNLNGYVKNEYLTFGTEAKGLADHYGVPGVEASWDDVYVFAAPDPNADIIHTAMAGEKFEVVEDQGHWIKIKFGEEEGQVAYVSEDDTTDVLLVDIAATLDELKDTEEDSKEVYQEETEAPSYDQDNNWSDNSGSDNSWTDPNAGNGGSSDNSGSGDNSWTDPNAGNGGSSDNTTQPDTEDNGSSDDTTDDGWTDDTTDDTTGDEWTDDTTDDTVTDDNSSDSSDGSGDDVIADDYEDVEDVEIVDDAEEIVDDNAADYSEGEEVYSEETVTETEAESAASSDDLDLMAALIYCEAGNQSYDGMVAVGSVVMNRVENEAFPDTVSDVIYQSGQFTPASSGALDSALANGVPSACYDAAAAALNGEAPVGDALYFNAGSGTGTQLGDHQFY